MPLKDDLLQRTLDQLAEVVRSLASLQQANDFDEAEAVLQEAYRKHTGSEAALFRRLPSEQILSVLSSAGVVDRDKSFLIATLFKTEAALREARGEDVQVGLQVKALDLYLEAALAELDTDELPGNIAQLEQQLASYALPVATQWRLFEYSRFLRRYDDAEDKLFDLLEQLGPTDEVTTRGRRFYTALLATPPERLEAGGLPLAEVREGATAFETALVAASP